MIFDLRVIESCNSLQDQAIRLLLYGTSTIGLTAAQPKRYDVPMTRVKLTVLILGCLMKLQSAWAEPKIVVLSEQKVHGLCELRSETPYVEGLTDLEVQKKINDILAKDIRSDFIYFSSDFETNDFCKEGLGNQIVIGVESYFLSDNLISISIHVSGDRGAHPWYDRRSYNFDPHTGKKYSLKDVIPEETIDWIKERLKQQIEKNQHKRVDDLDISGKRLFEERLETFFIAWDEIIFDFNTYLFGHVAGPTVVEIKLRELAPKLPKNNLLFNLTREKSGT